MNDDVAIPPEYWMPGSVDVRVSVPALRNAAENYRRKGWEWFPMSPDVIV